VHTGSLFEEESQFDRDGLAEKLRALAHRNVFIGGSSWKYEGWLGQIYSRERYLARGKFSKRVFEAECLSEYAETFPTVCGDFAFYQFPTQEFWDKLFSRVPENFRFAFKVPEQITCKVFPIHDRYGAVAGKDNEAFLDPHIFQEMFVRPLAQYGQKTALLIFEFGTFSRRSFAGVHEFIDRLDPFLATLGPEFRYAVEIRNADFLERDYFACLRQHNVAHVYNAWSKMPELRYQMAIPDSKTADFQVCRGLLRQGRVYEKAVEAFAPYTHVQDPNPEARASMRSLVEQALGNKEILFMFINNRLEGNSPETILSLLNQ
jgi:uncharacterized protein YecE (DUF72 family)